MAPRRWIPIALLALCGGARADVIGPGEPAPRVGLLAARGRTLERALDRRFGRERFLCFAAELSIPEPFVLAVESRRYQAPEVVARDYGSAIRALLENARARLGEDLPWERVLDRQQPLLVVVLDHPELGERVLAPSRGAPRAIVRSLAGPDHVPEGAADRNPWGKVGYHVMGQILDELKGGRPVSPWLRAGLCESAATLERDPGPDLEPRFGFSYSRPPLLRRLRRMVREDGIPPVREIVALREPAPSGDPAALCWALLILLEGRHRSAFLGMVEDEFRGVSPERSLGKRLRLRSAADRAEFDRAFQRFVREELPLLR